VDREWLEERLAAGASYEELAREAGCSASKISYWARKHGLRSGHVDRHSARGAIDETLLRELVGYGFSIREIAAGLDRSPAAVRHWMATFELKTRRRRRPSLASTIPPDASEVALNCPRHGVARHVRRSNGWRCAACRSETVTRRRQRIKRILVAEAGGSCILCGYRRCVAALHFHHVDPRDKSFALGVVGVTRSLAAARAEAAKCVLLCANCHAEVESGATDIPATLTPTCASGARVVPG
jgi:transposase-like protein